MERVKTVDFTWDYLETVLETNLECTGDSIGDFTEGYEDWAYKLYWRHSFSTLK